jgi:heme-degrading monooxygenase HmoA
MIRAVYRWSVPPDRRADFAAWWHHGTLRIRSTRSGALGSILLAPVDDADHLVAIARWRSRRDLEAFWAEPGGDPFEGASLVSAEVLDELDDLSVPGDGPAR